jgi:hypothetical protein
LNRRLTAVASASAESGEGVFSAAIMAAGAYVASAIARFVGVEVVESRLTTPRQWSVVTVMWVKAVVNVAVEPGMAVKPRTSTNKQPANKPVGAVVTVWGTVIWGIVEVSVRANGRYSNADGNLGWT